MKTQNQPSSNMAYKCEVPDEERYQQKKAKKRAANVTHEVTAEDGGNNVKALDSSDGRSSESNNQVNGTVEVDDTVKLMIWLK